MEIDEVRWSNIDRYNGKFAPVRRFESDANSSLLVHFDEGSGSTIQEQGVKRLSAKLPSGYEWRPEGSSNDARITNLQRYALIDGDYTFEQAKADSVRRGGHLLTLSGAEEWSKVRDVIGGRLAGAQVWIGMERIEEVWKWVTNDSTYRRWEGGVEGTENGGVLLVGATGNWRLGTPDMEAGYLIEWESPFEEIPDAGITAASEMSTFVSVDVDGDGRLDLVNGSSDWPSYSRPRVFLGRGDGVYDEKLSPFKGPIATTIMWSGSGIWIWMGAWMRGGPGCIISATCRRGSGEAAARVRSLRWARPGELILEVCRAMRSRRVTWVTGTGMVTLMWWPNPETVRMAYIVSTKTSPLSAALDGCGCA